MTMFCVDFTVTERTRQRVWLDAASAEEAREMVGLYEFDNSTATQTNSFEWSVSDVETVAHGATAPQVQP